jgi:protein SCO1/2
MTARRSLGVRLVVRLALAAALLGCADSPAAPARPRMGGVQEHLAAPLPLDAPFQSTSGKTVRLGDVVGRGQPAVLVLAYSRCAMLCSLVLRATADLVPRLGLTAGKDYDLLTISIDPRETPFEAGRTRQVALERAGLAPAEVWPFLVGQEASIRRVAESVGFSYQWDAASEQFAHPAVIFTLSPEGRVSGYFYDLAPDPAAVRAALLGQGTPAARSLGAAVLSCFRFDAFGRKYGPLVQRCFQGGATLVALLLVLGVGSLLRRERRMREASR